MIERWNPLFAVTQVTCKASNLEECSMFWIMLTVSPKWLQAASINRHPYVSMNAEPLPSKCSLNESWDQERPSRCYCVLPLFFPVVSHCISTSHVACCTSLAQSSRKKKEKEKRKNRADKGTYIDSGQHVQRSHPIVFTWDKFGCCADVFGVQVSSTCLLLSLSLISVTLDFDFPVPLPLPWDLFVYLYQQSDALCPYFPQFRHSPSNRECSVVVSP